LPFYLPVGANPALHRNAADSAGALRPQRSYGMHVQRRVYAIAGAMALVALSVGAATTAAAAGQQRRAPARAQ